MLTAIFEAPTNFDSEEALRRAFGCDQLYLAAGGTLVVDGEITLAPGAAFVGRCSLGPSTTVLNGSVLTNVRLGAGNVVRPYSVLSDLTAGARNVLGPFCFIRDNCTIADGCILGAHVEAARSRFASSVRVSHHAFIGDAEIADDTIIGASVVFCNFDGTGRQATRVGARVTVGSGTLLVPPLVIGEGAVIGAGSTVTKDVPANARVIQKR